ncbi:MAG: response regulator [Proteobacteria bacterium]|nr:response regulator [Pseudomonadota bacterium]
MQKLKVLIVDDEQSICEGVAMILTKAGYLVSKAFSGEEAIRLVSSERFDLVLMDLIMPGMDGADACAEIKKISPETRFIGISGSPAGQRVERFVSVCGVDVFLYKPFGKKELLAAVEKMLS